MFKRILTIALLAALLLVGINYRAIADWWLLRGYQPPSQIEAMATRTNMTDTGRRYFYLGRPQLDQKAEFNQDCPSGELSLVLGCYNLGRIYILQVDRPELAAVMDVTAAHEMLHAAYARLSSSEKSQVNSQINSFYQSVSDPKIKELVAEYDRAEPGDRLNELHSILPTQLESLSPELETYYQQYFSNRRAVAAAYKSYEAIFENLESQIAGLKTEIERIRSQLGSLEATLDSQRQELDRLDGKMSALLSANRIAEYNALVPQQNSLVRQYNGNVEYYRQLVASHNAKVEQINQLALEQNELVDALDSTKYTPL